jgi:prepilin-type N-terminal cleavage/methylation domain-containing protein
MRITTQYGFSLLELMLVIGAIAVLAGVMLVGTGVLASSKLSRAEQEIDTLASAAQAYAAQQPSTTYAGVSLTELKNRQLIPPSAAGTNPWGNTYTITGTAVGFTITTDTGDPTRCAALAGRFATRALSASCSTGSLTVTY